MTQTRQPAPFRGAVHADLVGSSDFLTFRPRRLLTAELNHQLACRGTIDSIPFGPFPVIDISSTGLAINLNDEISLSPGTSIDRLELLFRDSVFWKGSATSVYHVEGQTRRAGLRFSSGLLDLQLIQVTDSLEARLEQSLKDRKRSEAVLSPEWRAAISGLRGLLEDVRDILGSADENLDQAPNEASRDKKALFRRVFENWSRAFYAQQESLFHLSSGLHPGHREIAQSYASRELLPLVYSSPMYQRAFDKPLGYAGDYRLIEMYFADSFVGEGLYAQFLQYLAQRYPLGEAVRSREVVMRDHILATIQSTPKSRVVSLACGPAVELQNLLNSIPASEHSTEFVLVDQDEQAMHFAHNALSRSLLAMSTTDGLGVRLNGLNISVKQILRPKDDLEAEVVRTSLGNAQLIYAAGLYDYLPDSVAVELTERLYGLLKPGGILLVGNLKVCQVSSWIMEYVLSWHLQYRTEKTMKTLGQPLVKLGAKCRVILDETGLCVFLKATKPSN